MTHGSLFSGIGGFDLAAEWMGWENKFHCEWNEFGQKVLHYYWPNAELFTDITKSDFTKYANKIDVLTGGFPCQPYSQAGKRLGKEDDRHLWPEMLRTIREIKPSWVVGENVYGLVNWNGGLVFHEVQSDLEAEGYEVFPVLLPAAAVNAPHRRDRIWFIAYCKNNGLNKCDSDNEVNTSQGRVNAFSNFEQSNGNGDAPNTKNIRCGRGNCKECSNGKWKVFQGKQGWNKMGCKVEGCNREQTTFSSTINGIYESESIVEHTDCIRQKRWMHKNKSKTSIRKQFSKRNARSNESTSWQNFPTVSPICNGDDGLSNRLDSITFPKWRNESIKAGGNAIVPQVVYQIFKAIEQYEQQRPSNTTNK